MDSVPGVNMRELTALILAHVDRVRQLSGLEQATAIIVAECNQPFVAEDLYYSLRQGGIQRAVLLELGPALGRGSKRSHEGVIRAPDAQPGDFSPGIWMTRERKQSGLKVIQRAMEAGRLHLHRDFITYSNANVQLEMQRAEDAGYDLVRMVESHNRAELNDGRGRRGAEPVVPARSPEFAQQVHRALAAAEKARMERLVYKEFGWMHSVVTKSKQMRTGLELTNVHVTGKGGRDPEDGSDRRDDLVMGLVMLLLGANGFYTEPSYATERARLAIF